VKRFPILMTAVILVLPVLPAEVEPPPGENPLAALIERLIVREGADETGAAYLRNLTPPLFDFLRSRLPPEALAPLYEAGSMAELRSVLKEQVGPGVLDFGAAMFEYFENQPDSNKAVGFSSWKTAVSERFVFFFRPESRAEEDADFIAASCEEALSAILSTLDMEHEVARNQERLHFARPDQTIGVQDVPSAGRIAVYLHPARSSGGDKLKKSLGGMTFGATILQEGPEKGAGRLTARIDALYLNPLFLSVLHHEIAHAALFLGSFDATALSAKALQGESDLRKAFFAGYKAIPPFLQEGVGDCLFYYQVIYPRWPLLPSPREMTRELAGSKGLIPLVKLLKEGSAFRSQRRKAYSLQAATVIDYVFREYGPAKLKAWLLSPVKDGVKSFENIYGLAVEDFESRWKASLLGEQE